MSATDTLDITINGERILVGHESDVSIYNPNTEFGLKKVGSIDQVGGYLAMADNGLLMSAESCSPSTTGCVGGVRAATAEPGPALRHP